MRALVVAVTSAATAVTWGIVATAAPAGSPNRAVTYHGLTLRVPTSWPVIDLAARPSTCVRFDRHAVYLGTPGADQDCPAIAFGRADAILVQPAAGGSLDAAAPTSTAVGAAPAGAAVDPTAREVRTLLAGTGLTVVASYARSPRAVSAIIAGATYAGPTVRTPAALEPAAAGSASPAAAMSPFGVRSGAVATGGGTITRYAGLGFDTCAAPSVAAMAAWWRHSPYGAVGIYVGGANRACGWGNLSPSWVRRVAGMGWRLQPIYVGRQASCAFQHGMVAISRTLSTARSEGTAAANDAVRMAGLLGLGRGSAIYVDMEAYRNTNSACNASVLSFLSAWTTGLHAKGYLSGVYSSSASGVYALSRVYTSRSYVNPDVIWAANWNGVKTVWNDRFFPNSQWPNHQRVKQYRGPVTQSYGGVKINVDVDYYDGLVASPSYAFRVDAPASLNGRTGPSTRYPVVGSHPDGSGLAIVCQLAGQRVYGNPMWDQLTDGSFVSDYYTTTPGKTGFSRPLPRCESAYQVTARPALRKRARPTTASRAVGSFRYGGLAFVICQGPGQRIGSSAVWDQLASGSWISKVYTTAPGGSGYTPGLLRCP